MQFRGLQRLIVAMVVGGLCASAYFGYRMWSESRESHTENVSYVKQVTADLPDWSDLTRRDAIQAERRAPMQQAPGQKVVPGKCAKVAELIVPALGSEVYHINYSPAEKTEEECLRKGPILMHRGVDNVFPGEPGLTVISGHRHTHFRVFEKIYNRKLLGSYAFVNDGRTFYRYQLRAIRTVKGSDPVLAEYESKVPPGKNRLLITTCYPFWGLGDQPNRAVFEYDLVGKQASDGLHYAWQRKEA